MELLKKMCEIHAPSGEEVTMKEFMQEYIENNKNNWKVKPKLHTVKDFKTIFNGIGEHQRLCYLRFSGFIKYNNEIVKIGGPVTDDGIVLVGEDSIGKVEGKVINKGDKIYIDYPEQLTEEHL